MTTVHNLTHSELAREAKRRGMEVRYPQVELTPCESAAITLLVAAAEECQAGDDYASSNLAYVAHFVTVRGSWLERFARSCWIGSRSWAMWANND